MNNNAISINAKNLYTLSNYEKGKLTTSALKFFFARKRLTNSLKIMLQIENVLEGDSENIDAINIFIKRYTGIIFPVNCEMCTKVVSTNYSNNQLAVINKMQFLIHEMESILSKGQVKKADCYNFYCLIHAFHNLPRAFICDSSILFMNSKDALQIADEWLLRIYH